MRDCIKAPYFTKNKFDETSLRKVRAIGKKVNRKSRICFKFLNLKREMRGQFKPYFLYTL